VESDQPGPKNVYGRSKLAGEEVVRAYPRGHIVRTSGVFGGRLDGKPERNFFRGIAERLMEAPESDQVPVIADHYTAVTYAPHLADMLLELIGTGLPPVVHLVSQGSDSWYGWAMLAAQQLGVDEGRLKAVSAAELGDSTPRPAFSVLGTELPAAAALIEGHPASAGVAAYMNSLLARKSDRQLA
jgi:dTDP-4-dehydrorhamnose reductase